MSNAPLFRIVHSEASIGWGGQEIRILTEAAKFAAEGHTTHLICDPESEIFSAAPSYGIECTAIPMKRKSFAGLMAMRRFMAEWKPDIFNTHSSIDSWLAAGARLGLDPRPTIVRTRHISAPVSRGIATRWIYNKGCDGLMTTSQSIVNSLTSDGFLPLERVRAVPTGIDTEFFAPGDKTAARAMLQLPADDFIFTIVATLRSWKGHRFLLDALSRLADRNIHLLIVGDGPQEENLRGQIAELGIGDQVTLTGRQSDVVPYLQAADAFALPSTENEGVPQALLQAMACRLPIVACPVGGIPELLEGLPAVHMAAPKDADSLVTAMAAVMREPADDASLDALRGRVVEEFSRDVMYEKALAVFYAAISANRG